MASGMAVPELREILGAMIFGAGRPLSIKELRRCLLEVAQTQGQETAAFAAVKESDVAAALGELGADIARWRCGLALKEVAGGFRFQTNPACGKWLRHLLNAKSNRLSRPALETLAIIAYRQPISRPEIEAIRGVNVDHIVRLLLEMQLIRIAGRSDLPGRPFLYGTTQAFLEHFGLRDLNDLKEIEPSLLALRERAGRVRPAREAATEPSAAAAPAAGGEPGKERQEQGAEEENAVSSDKVGNGAAALADDERDIAAQRGGEDEEEEDAVAEDAEDEDGEEEEVEDDDEEEEDLDEEWEEDDAPEAERERGTGAREEGP